MQRNELNNALEVTLAYFEAHPDTEFEKFPSVLKTVNEELTGDKTTVMVEDGESLPLSQEETEQVRMFATGEMQ